MRCQDGRAERNLGSFRPKGMAKRRPSIWVTFLLVGVLSDERVEYQKSAPSHDGFEWAGAVARVRRGARFGSCRPSCRLAEGMLTAAYANSSRGTRTTDRSGSER